MLKWIKSKISRESPASAWIIQYQLKSTSPWLTFAVAGVQVMVRTKKEAKQHARKLHSEGVWNTKIIPVRGGV